MIGDRDNLHHYTAGFVSLPPARMDCFRNQVGGALEQMAGARLPQIACAHPALGRDTIGKSTLDGDECASADGDFRRLRHTIPTKRILDADEPRFHCRDESWIAFLESFDEGRHPQEPSFDFFEVQ